MLKTAKQAIVSTLTPVRRPAMSRFMPGVLWEMGHFWGVCYDFLLWRHSALLHVWKRAAILSCILIDVGCVGVLSQARGVGLRGLVIRNIAMSHLCPLRSTNQTDETSFSLNPGSHTGLPSLIVLCFKSSQSHNLKPCNVILRYVSSAGVSRLSLPALRPRTVESNFWQSWDLSANFVSFTRALALNLGPIGTCASYLKARGKVFGWKPIIIKARWRHSESGEGQEDLRSSSQ